MHSLNYIEDNAKHRAKSAGSSITDSWISLSDPTTEEEVTRPMGRDRDKTAVQKGKRKECSSSLSESYSVVGDMISTLKKLDTSFAKT
jgi:hypothetical protein